MATIFLSHSSQNDALASTLEGWLRANGFDDIFIDHVSIRTGDKWAEELRAAKASCRVVLCLVTPEWLHSDECYAEFRAAWYMGRRIIALHCLTGSEAQRDPGLAAIQGKCRGPGSRSHQGGRPGGARPRRSRRGRHLQAVKSGTPGRRRPRQDWPRSECVRDRHQDSRRAVSWAGELWRRRRRRSHLLRPQSRDCRVH